MVGSHHLSVDAKSKLLKIDKTTPNELNIVQDPSDFRPIELESTLQMIAVGNQSSGGLKNLGRFQGLIGFVKFLESFYIILIQKKSQIAQLGKYRLFHLDDIKVIRLSAAPAKAEVSMDESRYMQTFLQVDLGKNFYFSYNYDLTNTLQRNMTLNESLEVKSATLENGINRLFMWNEFLFEHSALSLDKSSWVIPLIHGFADQSRKGVCCSKKAPSHRKKEFPSLEKIFFSL